ncbi:MAG: hypothetical protein K6E62_07410, partial [Lachnospiraceae bacterium]|nr:hypothetical protein [Lachnospiraceae bacterium]
YIKDPSDKKERRAVAAKLYLSVFFTGVAALLASYSQNPAVKNGSIRLATILVSPFMYIGFVWGFFITGFWVRPPKQSRYLYDLPDKPNYILFTVGVILILINTFVLGPGIHLN